MKRALITGINGQDGSYLAEFLIDKGYEVHGTVRRTTLENRNKLVYLSNIIDDISLHPCSIEEHLAIYKLMRSVQPDECYHLAAQSFVDYSFENDSSIMETNFNSTLFLLGSIRELCPDCKFYFAGSSEMFGNPDESPQTENTKFNPKSLYGISKLASYYIVNNYRSQHGIFACTGIAYNHESPRRGHEFVTRKISSGLAKIFTKKLDKLELGNIDTVRDWGYAPDYVKGMWMMLQKSDGPKDYILATGIPHTVRDFLTIAFETLGLDYENHIQINKKFFRQSEKIPLIGDPSSINNDLGWKNTTSFKDMVKEMIYSDLELLKN